MAIDFPSSPTNGQTFASGSVTYTWDGTKWTAVAAGGPSDRIIEGNTSAEVIDTGSDGRFVVTTEGSERLRVTAAGYVGLGVSNPGQLLELNSASSPCLLIKDTTNNVIAYTFADDSAATFGSASAHPTVFKVNDNERARIDTSGRLGVGTASPASRLDLNGAFAGNVTAVAALNIDCSLGNIFTKTINGASTFTVSNVPASRSYAFTLELTHTSGAITWFSGVVWPGGTAPTLTTGKVHLFMFFTDDGGTTWRASSLINY